MRLLLTGDLHIGRTSTRFRAGGVSELTSRSAWTRIVEAALEWRCDAILLSGDVADQENGFWEAVGPLREGQERLAAAGIRTVAVAGNHDHSVLGRLADTLDPAHFTLLGRGGRWERLTLEREGTPVLHIDGWSFPSGRVTDSPLEGYHLPPDRGVPTLGLIHGDLDAPASVYAPLASAELRAKPVEGWLLGHIHAPALHAGGAGGPWILYPGSPQALHPGETGAHGVWMVEVTGGGVASPRLRPLSTTRYESLQVDVGGIRDPEALEPHLLHTVTEAASRLLDESGDALRHLSLRLTLTGQTRIPEAIPGVLEALTRSEPEGILQVERVRIHLDGAGDATVPHLDLEEAAAGPSALGTAARLVLVLEGRREPAAGERQEVEVLVERTRSRLERLRRERVFQPLRSGAVTELEVREHLREEARRLLGALASQTLETGA